MNMREVAIPIDAWNGLFAFHLVFPNIIDGSHVPKPEPRNTDGLLFGRVSVSMAR